MTTPAIFDVAGFPLRQHRRRGSAGKDQDYR